MHSAFMTLLLFVFIHIVTVQIRNRELEISYHATQYTPLHFNLW